VAGGSEALVGDGGTGWAAGQTVLLLSSAFNPWQVGSRHSHRTPRNPWHPRID
jgi:hypothetical protein